MRITRRRARRRQVVRLILRCTGRWLLPCALLGLAASSPMAGPTLARIGESRFGGEAQIRALSTAGSLALSAPNLDLGTLTAGAPVSVPVALRVRNTSSRALPLAATVVGTPGLTAGVSPHWLAPGESAVVWIAGQAPDPGPLTARLRISAYAEFLTVEAAIRGQVQAPPPPAPSAAAADPDPDQSGDGRTNG